MSYEKTTVPHHVLDKTSGAILNTDLDGYRAAKAARQAFQTQNSLIHEVAALRDEINTIKDVLNQLLAKEQ